MGPNSETDTAEADQWIVRFSSYRMAEEHREALAGSLGGETAGAKWHWVERRNPAMAYPTDFGVLEFSNSEAQALKRALESLEFVKDVHPQMAHTRSLMFEETRAKDGGKDRAKNKRRMKTSRRHKDSYNIPEGAEVTASLRGSGPSAETSKSFRRNTYQEASKLAASSAAPGEGAARRLTSERPLDRDTRDLRGSLEEATQSSSSCANCQAEDLAHSQAQSLEEGLYDRDRSRYSAGGMQEDVGESAWVRHTSPFGEKPPGRLRTRMSFDDEELAAHERHVAERGEDLVRAAEAGHRRQAREVREEDVRWEGEMDMEEAVWPDDLDKAHHDQGTKHVVLPERELRSVPGDDRPQLEDNSRLGGQGASEHGGNNTSLHRKLLQVRRREPLP